MNKLTKASIAGAAGIALLLGGAGTLALWNDSASLTADSISSGTLTISDSAGTWDVNAPDLWVPGDSFTYTGTLAISATGDNLEATLTVDINDFVATNNNEFADELDVAFTASGTGISLVGGVYHVTPGASTTSVDVVVTVTFPDAVDGTTAQGLTVDLDGIDFVLQQI